MAIEAPVRQNGARRGSPPFSTSMPSARPRRAYGRVWAGVAIMFLFALVAAVVYKDVGNRRPVLALAHLVEPGTPIQDSDLAVARVSSDPAVRPVPGSMRSSIVGRIAAVRLMPGTLLSLAQLSNGAALPAGSVVIGALLHPGQYPVGLRVGDRVQIVVAVGIPAGGSTPTTGSSPLGASTATPAASGTVLAVDRMVAGTGGVTVSLVVPSDASAQLASAGSAGGLDLVVLGS